MKHYTITLIMVLFVFSGWSQDKKPFGLSANIQSTQWGISLPAWTSEKHMVIPTLGVMYAEKVSTDLAICLGNRFYFKKEKVSPYLGINLGIVYNTPSSENVIDSDSKMDLLGGLSYGVEYFVADDFSVGIEAQGNIVKSDENSYRYGNPDGINFNTAAALFVTIYLN